MPEPLVLGIIIVVGALLARDVLRLHRWSPQLFRGGPVVYRESRPLARIPDRVPTPEIATGLFYSAQYRTLGPAEVAFTAQTFNAPLLLGRLEIDRVTSALTATGKLHWGLWGFFIMGLLLVGFPWPAMLFVGALAAINYALEVRAFRRVLTRAAEAADQAA